MARNQENPKEISSFLLEKADGGSFKVNAIKDKMGVRGSNTGEMVLENHRIPKENLIGKVGDGFKYAMHMLNGGRNTIGAWSIGIAQGALEKFMTYAFERKLFGKYLKDLDNTKKEVSEMLIAIRGARELVYAAAYEKGIGHKNFPQNAALCKVAGTEASVYVCERVIELAGGFGYLQESNLERPLRDAILGRIGEGANELLKVVVIPRFYYKFFEENPPLPTW
jgi:butyryl-CoA dehydrogenase